MSLKPIKSRKRKQEPEEAIRPWDILQIRFGPEEPWQDYGTIRDDSDAAIAAAKVARGVHMDAGQRVEFRVIRQFMGKKVVRGPKV